MKTQAISTVAVMGVLVAACPAFAQCFLLQQAYFNHLNGGAPYNSFVVNQAYANYLNGLAMHHYSMAAMNYQRAYGLALENREKMVENYFRVRALNDQFRAARRPKPLSHEQYVELAQKNAPYRLTERQYDRKTGILRWPFVLQWEEFASERNEVTYLFLTRTPEDYGPETAFYYQVRRLTGQLELKLREKLGLVSPAEYMTAKNFVLSLAYEAQKPLTDVGR